MPFVRVAYRVAPVRPATSSHQTVDHLSTNRRRPVAPRFLPVLQPPAFFQQSDFIYEDEEVHQQQQQNEKHDRLAIVDHKHGKKVTQMLSVRVPEFVPQQNYPKQPLPRLHTRPIRHAEPKYSPYLYTTR